MLNRDIFRFISIPYIYLLYEFKIFRMAKIGGSPISAVLNSLYTVYSQGIYKSFLFIMMQYIEPSINDFLMKEIAEKVNGDVVTKY